LNGIVGVIFTTNMYVLSLGLTVNWLSYMPTEHLLHLVIDVSNCNVWRKLVSSLLFTCCHMFACSIGGKYYSNK